MPEYNSTEYWDNRYGQVFPEPFDWLFAYKDVKGILQHYIEPHHRILIVGCGNAPFSPDLYDDGYCDLHNIDTSAIVIEQCIQRNELRPGMQFRVMDVTAMDYPDNYFDSVIDKSLVDTLMCCEGSDGLLHKMYQEIFRVMKPGAPLLTFSLHQEGEVVKYINHDDFNWVFASLRLPNPRYDPVEHPERSRDHSFVVSVKLSDEVDQNVKFVDTIAAAMKQKIQLQIHYDQPDKLKSTSLDRLMSMLDNSLAVYQKMANHPRGHREIPRVIQHVIRRRSEEEVSDTGSHRDETEGSTREQASPPTPSAKNEKEGVEFPETSSLEFEGGGQQESRRDVHKTQDVAQPEQPLKVKRAEAIEPATKGEKEKCADVKLSKQVAGFVNSMALDSITVIAQA